MAPNPETDERDPRDGDVIMKDAMTADAENATNRAAFLSRRCESYLAKKGRELRSIPPEYRVEFDKSDLKEWTKWLAYDSVERLSESEVAEICVVLIATLFFFTCHFQQCRDFVAILS